MAKTKVRRNLLAHAAILAGLGSLLVSVQPLGAQSSAFSYHGFLTDQGRPANAIYDLRFALYDAATDGLVAAEQVDLGDVSVTNGLFNVMLDFGGAAFDGSDRWLEIAVRPGASTADFTNVVPRQKITATPYAIRAANYSGPVDASQITGKLAPSHISDGMITSEKLAAGAVAASLTSGDQGSLVLDGCGLTNLNAGSLASGTIPAARFPAVLPAIDGSRLTGITGVPSPVPNTLTNKSLTSGSGQVFLRAVPTETNATSGDANWTWSQSIANQSTNSYIIYSHGFNYENGHVVDTNKHAWVEVWEQNWDPFEVSNLRQMEHYRVFIDRTTGENYRYEGETLRDNDIEISTHARYVWWGNNNRVNHPAVTMILDDADSGYGNGTGSAVVGISGVLALTGTAGRGPASISLAPSAAHNYSPYILINNAQATKSLTISGGGEGYQQYGQALADQALIWAGQDILRLMAAQQILMSTNVAVLGNVSGSNFIGNGAQLSGTASAAGGFLLKSNSWQAIPTLQEGDVWLGSSNGILHSISMVAGTYTTNRLVP